MKQARHAGMWAAGLPLPMSVPMSALPWVLQARPTRDYDPLYGSESGEWTTDMFVRAVYESLTAQR